MLTVTRRPRMQAASHALGIDGDALEGHQIHGKWASLNRVGPEERAIGTTVLSPDVGDVGVESAKPELGMLSDVPGRIRGRDAALSSSPPPPSALRLASRAVPGPTHPACASPQDVLHAAALPSEAASSAEGLQRPQQDSDIAHPEGPPYTRRSCGIVAASPIAGRSSLQPVRYRYTDSTFQVALSSNRLA